MNELTHIEINLVSGGRIWFEHSEQDIFGYSEKDVFVSAAIGTAAGVIFGVIFHGVETGGWIISHPYIYAAIGLASLAVITYGYFSEVPAPVLCHYNR